MKKIDLKDRFNKILPFFTKRNVIIIISSIIAIAFLIILKVYLIPNVRHNTIKQPDEIEYCGLCPVPVESYSDVNDLAYRLDSLSGKKIGILVNNKRSASILCDVIRNKIKSEYPSSVVTVYTYDLVDDINSFEKDSNVINWISNKDMDAIISLVGDCTSSVKSVIRNSAFIENKINKPTVSITVSDMRNEVNQAKDDNEFPSLRVVFANIEKECRNKSIITSEADKIMDEIEDALVLGITESERNAVINSEKNKMIAYTGNYSDLELYYYQNGWTDGLPIVPPTEDKVKEILKGTKYESNYGLGCLSPEKRLVTIESIAINAVMAGCTAQDMPVIIGAIKGMIDSSGGYGDIATSQCSFAPVITVDGDIVSELNLSGEDNVLCSNNRSNAAIGRAIRLIMNNIGGLEISVKDKGIYGNPGDDVIVIGKADKNTLNKYEWYGSRAGLAQLVDKMNTISVSYQTSYRYCKVESSDAEKIIASIVNEINDHSVNNLTNIVISTELIKTLSKEKYDENKFIKAICDKCDGIDKSELIITPVDSKLKNGIYMLYCDRVGAKSESKYVELPKNWNQVLTDVAKEGKKTVEEKKGVAAASGADDLTKIIVEEVYDVNNYYNNNQSDGLPVIAATDNRINEMLRGTDYEADHLIGIINGHEVTVRMIAIDSVIAGCIPTYLPVVIAGMECICEQGENFTKAYTGESSTEAIMSVCGNILNKVQISKDGGTLGGGVKANATIGRAIDLILKNIAKIDHNNQYGSPADGTEIIGEYGENILLEWCEGDENANYVRTTDFDSYSYIMADDITCKSYLKKMVKYADRNSDRNIRFILSSDEVNIMTKNKYSKEQVIKYIIDNCEHKLSIEQIEINVINDNGLTGIAALSAKKNKKGIVTKQIKIPKKYDDLISEYINYSILSTDIPKSIEITSVPDKVMYVTDSEVFDPSGIEVTAKYDNGATQIINEKKLSFSVSYRPKLSESIVRVAYKGMKAEFQIEVVPIIIERIIVSKKPDKVNYGIGETFDPKGMEITAILNSGETYEIDVTKCKIQAPEELSNKKNTIKITYGITSTALEVNVAGSNEGEDVKDDINIINLSAEQNVADKNINVDCTAEGGSGDYEYRYYIINEDISSYMIGNVYGTDEKETPYINTEQMMNNNLSWYNRQFMGDKKIIALGGYSKDSANTYPYSYIKKMNIVVEVRDKSGNTACFLRKIGVAEDKYNYVNIRAKVPDGCKEIPIVYVWYDGDNAETNYISANWPGDVMKPDAELGDGWYVASYDMAFEYYNFIISFTGERNQTSDNIKYTGDTWTILNKTKLSSEDDTCASVYTGNPRMLNNNINIKTYSDSSAAPYVYVWDKFGRQLVGNMPGREAQQNKALGDNWYTLPIMASDEYSFIITDSTGSVKTKSIKNCDSDIWAVINKSELSESDECITKLPNITAINQTHSIYVKQQLKEEKIPYIYAWDEIQGSIFKSWPGVFMKKYPELEGKWFTYDVQDKRNFYFQISNGKNEWDKDKAKYADGEDYLGYISSSEIKIKDLDRFGK